MSCLSLALISALPLSPFVVLFITVTLSMSLSLSLTPPSLFLSLFLSLHLALSRSLLCVDGVVFSVQCYLWAQD